MKPKISIITLAVDDLEKSLIFYRDGLGLQTQGIVNGTDHILFELQDSLSLVLYLRSEMNKIANQSNSSQRSSDFILSYTAESKEEVDSLLNRAKVAGGTLPSQPMEHDWGYTGYFKDLDGHLWEIVYFSI